MKKWRDEDLFPKRPADIPTWIAIRNADDERKMEKTARLRAARLARDAGEAETKKTDPPRRKRRAKK